MVLNSLFSQKIRMVTFSKKLLADMDTPVSSFYKLGHDTDSIMLESMEGNGSRGRFSVIGLSPIFDFKRLQDRTVVRECATGAEFEFTGDPFEHLKAMLRAFQFDRTSKFDCGMLCGYISYDAIRYIEKIPADAVNDLQLPDMYFILPYEVIIFDNLTHTIELVVHLEANAPDLELAQRAEQRLTELINRILLHAPNLKELKPDSNPVQSAPRINISNKDYRASVLRAQQYIRNGDIFQVVLSRRMEKDLQCPPFDIYRTLRLINPSPYMFYLNFGRLKILGSSPETLVRLEDNRVTVRPIAGTRKRGTSEAEDARIARELLNDEKEIAEHVMLVDLGRNDVGRIARYGTVGLETFKKIENYSHVMHIVSTVTGVLAEGFDAVDVFKACFPAGTVSGAPKIRAMEIIDELEYSQRGPYAGAIGYFDFSGRMDTCIAIRTLVVKDQTAYWQAGGGIVADSQPDTEFEETENKARALYKAITLAEEVNNDCRN